MKAFLINPEARSIETIDVADRAAIAKLIGYDTIESDAVGTADDGQTLRDVTTDIENLRARIKYL